MTSAPQSTNHNGTASTSAASSNAASSNAVSSNAVSSNAAPASAAATATLPLVVRQVSTGYGSRQVLEDVSLQVELGEFLAIVGPNGGGKTTLLRAILGMLPVWTGEIRVFGESPVRGRRHVGYVPQGIEFDPAFPIRVKDVVRMGRLGRRGLLRFYGRADRDAAAWALERVGLSDMHRRPIGELSGGQRQRVYIARALAAKPSLLVLDEPTAQVDPDSRAVVYELLREINREVTVVMVSHDLDAVANWCSRVACVDRRLYVTSEGVQRDPACGRVHLPPHSHGHAPAPSCDPSASTVDPNAQLHV